MISDIGIFFQPLSSELLSGNRPGTVGSRIQGYTDTSEFPKITSGSVVIVGVLENRGSGMPTDVSSVVLQIRRNLYQLKDHFGPVNLIDLGNITPGESLSDTYYAVSSSVAGIVQEGGIALIIGGSQDLTYAAYLAYEKLEQIVNLVTVDPRFDIGEAEDELRADQFMQKIILHQPNVLFNFSNIGYQTHHVLPKEADLLKKMYFDVYRLGEVQRGLEEVEPVVRNADLISFDLTSIRASDLPSNLNDEPNGFYGQEACAISRYAGLSDKLSTIGFFNTNPETDDQRSNKLVAQLIWYFIWGVSNRKKDYPFADKSEYTKYTVSIQNGQYDVVFYKSGRSDRWWMEVPYPSKRGEKYQRHFMVPCSYSDYQLACDDDIPDRWWQTFQKLG